MYEVRTTRTSFAASSISERTPLLSQHGGNIPPAFARHAAIKDDAERSALPGAHGVDSPPGAASPKANKDDAEVTVLAPELPLARLALVMTTAWFGVFLGAADTTVIATLSGPISSDLGSCSLLSWLATGYLIANAASQPVAGRLTDIFGRGPGLVFSNLSFAAGNLLCGLAGSPAVLVLGRVVAGVGGGGLMSIPTFLGSDLVPLRQRGLVGGVANLFYGVGAMAGAVAGGYLNDTSFLGWRMAFLIQVPPSLLSALCVCILVRVPPKQSDKSYWRRIDFAGVFLVTSFLSLLVVGLQLDRPWAHPLSISLLLLSAVLLVAFVGWESRVQQPIIPVRMLLNRTVLASCLASFFCAAISLTALFYVPLYLQVRGDSATVSGLKITPTSLGTSLSAIGTGYVMKRTGKYVGLGMGSAVCLVGGSVLFALQDAASPGWLTCVALFLAGSGYNAVFTVTQIACIAAVDHSYQAVVTSSTCKLHVSFALFPAIPRLTRRQTWPAASVGRSGSRRLRLSTSNSSSLRYGTTLAAGLMPRV